MKNIVNELAVCERRVIYRETTQSPWIILCKPPIAYLKTLSLQEIRNNIELVKPRIVTVETCKSCKGATQVTSSTKLLTDGTIVYKKAPTDWEPPPVLPGYKRKSDDPKSKDAWILVPDYPPCIYGELEKKEKAPCGCDRYNLICTREGKHILLLQKETCQECPHRIERKCNV